MSRDNFNTQCQIIDLFGANGSPRRVSAQTTSPDREAANSPGKIAQNHINEDMWTGTRKRHCDSREHLRSLLDRHLRPHV